jgi:hypothetical protein
VGERAITNVLFVPIPVSAALEGCVGERATTDVHQTAELGGGKPGRESLSASAGEFHSGVTIAPSASERQLGKESDEARSFQNWRRFSNMRKKVFSVLREMHWWYDHSGKPTRPEGEMRDADTAESSKH